MWHLLDYEKVLVDEVSRGQFHCRDTYIIRWQYRITVTGKDLKGQPSVHGLLGRDRFCYFIWHGAQAPPTDQGASALKTVELDEERGPHVRVQQGHEPPAFLAIFQGKTPPPSLYTTLPVVVITIKPISCHPLLVHLSHRLCWRWIYYMSLVCP